MVPTAHRRWWSVSSSTGVRPTAWSFTRAIPWKPVRFVLNQRARADFRRLEIDVTGAGVSSDPAGSPQLLAVSQPTLLWDTDEPSADLHDVPLLGDLDGDTKADFVVWSPATCTFRWLTSSGGYEDTAVRSERFNLQGRGGVGLLGDLDGDRKADLVVWRASRKTWYWRTSSTGYSERAGGSAQQADAQAGDVPLVADVDGDGKADSHTLAAQHGRMVLAQFVEPLPACREPEDVG